MLSYKYSRWDGTQQLFDLHEDDIMEELSEDLLDHGDLRRALRRLFQRGMQDRSGERLPGLQELMQRLRNMRQQRLNQYDLGSIVDEIQKKLEEVLQTEREGIQRRLNEARQRAQEAQQAGSTSSPQGQPLDQAQDKQGDTPQEAGEPSRGAPQAGQQSGQGGQSGSAGSPQGGQGEQGQKGQLSPEMAEQLLRYLERMAQEKQSFLDQLPEELGGAIRQLSEYEFMDPEAQRQFQELLEMLKQQVMDSMFQNMQQALQGMTPEQLQQLREMLRRINQMLKEQMAGGEPDFQGFMEQYGDMFGPNPPQSLEELMEQLQRQRAGMQSLLDSMTPEQRQALEGMVDSLVQDMGFREELADLAATMDYLYPTEPMRERYPFQGDESLTLREAMRLMEELQKMEELEAQMRATQRGAKLEDIDEEKLRETLGEEAAQQLELLKRIEKMLEEAGYLRRRGDKLELTAKGMRRIGQKALRDIFAQLRKDRFGRHELEYRGVGADRADETKIYEFGDPFLLHLERTLMNALHRDGPGAPVRLKPEDFEVYRTEYLTQSSTVILLDQSRSMGLTGRFQAAKKVAAALDSLIRTQFPRDNLYIVGFSDYAREMKQEELPEATWSHYISGTNMHHALMLSRRLLAKHKGGTKQIIMVSDGEPTAHLEQGNAYFNYPPSWKTIQETLKEVKRCTREQIVINTFMLDRTSYLMEFVDEMAKLNRGRVFYTSPEKLGEYVLVDYIRNKRRHVA